MYADVFWVLKIYVSEELARFAHFAQYMYVFLSVHLGVLTLNTKKLATPEKERDIDPETAT